jgi:hypothetical protein
MRPIGNEEPVGFVTLDQLQQAAQDKRFVLCPKCAERYEPCLVVIFYRIASANVAHIMPGAYEFGYRPVFIKNDFFLKASIRRKLLYTACEELVRSLELEEVNYKVIGQICGLSLRSHAQLDSFICYILQKYPGLNGRPITERTLREVGCPLEAEWAMWQLA